MDSNCDILTRLSQESKKEVREQSSLTYVWFANALRALQKNKTTVLQASLQLPFIVLMYCVQCKSIQNIDNWTIDNKKVSWKFLRE